MRDPAHMVQIGRDRRAISTNILDFRARVFVMSGGKKPVLTRSDSDPGHSPAPYSSDRRSPVLRQSPPDARSCWAVRRAVNTPWSRGCVDWRARLAGRRSGGLHAGPARRGRARRQGCRHVVSGATVHVVRRLSPKRRVGKHAIVFVDVERDQSTHGGDAVERVEEPPLMFI